MSDNNRPPITSGPRPGGGVSGGGNSLGGPRPGGEVPRQRGPGGPGGPGGGPGGGMRFMAGEKAKDLKGTVKKLIKELGIYKVRIGVVLFFAILSTIFNTLSPEIQGRATTEIAKGFGGGSIDFDYVGRILITVLVLHVFAACFNYINSFLMSIVAQTVAYNMRNQLSEKLHRIPMKYYDTKTHGEILSRLTNDIDSISMNLTQSLTQIINSAVSLVGTLGMMLFINPLMTLAALVMVPLSAFAISFIVKRSQKYYREQQRYLGYVNGHVEEVYGGHIVVKAFNKEETMTEAFDNYNDTLYRSGWLSQFQSGFMQPITMFFGNFSYAMLTVLGGFMYIRGNIQIGQIQAFVQYSRSLNQPINQSAQIINQLQSVAAAAERVFELLEEDEEEQYAEDAASTQDLTGKVSFEHVRFGYDSENPVIHDFTAEIEAGRKIAIVGPTGAGKTTLVKLLMRFYDIDDGSIMIDGIDIRDFNRQDLRKLFGMVLQDTWLFNDTIMENIRYGRLDATDEEVIEAAKSAFIHHYISTLPGTYHMVLSEDATNLSQGQKQLLTIARAILADPKILILDEATSSVDTRTEVMIQEAMDKLMHGRTSFIIAHRLSTIRNADKILVVNEGDIVEVGNHDELIQKKGFYYNLYMSQFEDVG